MRMYKSLKILRRGGVLNMEGILLRAAENQEIGPGDLYVAERNTGPVLLTAKEVHDNGLVIPTTTDYPYDIGECVKVREANN